MQGRTKGNERKEKIMLEGRCKKCNCTIRIRQGGLSRQGVIERLKKMETFECPGHHVEFGSPYPHYWNVDEFEELEDPPDVSEEDWLAEMRRRYKEVLDCEEFYKLGILKGFAFRFPVTTDGGNWNFADSPSGERYYFHS